MSEQLHTVCKAGKLRNGCERGKGTIWHLTQDAPWLGEKALCGALPAISWSEAWNGQTVTCKKCQKAAALKQGGAEAQK